jgi:hypothetical protein
MISVGRYCSFSERCDSSFIRHFNIPPSLFPTRLHGQSGLTAELQTWPKLVAPPLSLDGGMISGMNAGVNSSGQPFKNFAGWYYFTNPGGLMVAAA